MSNTNPTLTSSSTWNESFKLLIEAVNSEKNDTINHALLIHSCTLMAQAPYNLHKGTGTAANSAMKKKQVS
jgi:hypothetical protein